MVEYFLTKRQLQPIIISVTEVTCEEYILLQKVHLESSRRAGRSMAGM